MPLPKLLPKTHPTSLQNAEALQIFVDLSGSHFQRVSAADHLQFELRKKRGSVVQFESKVIGGETAEF
jgi:hypothetical protein